MRVSRMFAGLFLLSACGSGPDAGVDAQQGALVAKHFPRPNVVTEWARISADAIVRPNEDSAALRSPGQSAVLGALVQLAVYDALAAYERDLVPFSIDVDAPNGANRDDGEIAAAATAAYRVTRARVPGRGAFLDAKIAETMSAIEDSRAREAGAQIGEQVAAHYLALRANDGMDANVPYVQPTPGPGVFEPTAATTPGDVKLQFVPGYTFGNAAKASFFPAGPPALTSAAYAAAWTEARDYGRRDSAFRTADQTEIALFWAEHTFRHWARNLAELAETYGLNRQKSARLFAMAYTASADAVLTGFAAKYHFMFWRPFHSIPRADTDGNPATTADSTWSPLLNVNHPEYPSAHGFWSYAFLDALKTYFGTDEVTWTLTTVGVSGLPNPTSMTFQSLDDIGASVSDARVWSGLHYRFSMDGGRDLGRSVAAHVLTTHFAKRDD